MKIDFIPFRIGMQYENWEFDLDIAEDYDICEKYKYIKNDIIEILDVQVDEIYLYFNGDILVRVDIKFHTGTIPHTFVNLSVKLEAKYGKQILNSNDGKSMLFKRWRDIQKSLSLQHYLEKNEIYIIITKHRYFNL